MNAFLPYDLAQARKIASIVAGAAAVLLLLVTGASQPSTPPWPELGTAAVVAVLGGYVLRCRDRAASLVCVGLPILGITGIVILDLVTADTSAGAHVVFLLPVLYAATQLRPRGAYLVLVVALVGETVVCLAVAASAAGYSDLAHVVVVTATVGTVLVHSVTRQTHLHDALRAQAAVDPLTGLLTRRVLDDAARAALASAPGRHGTALLLVDIDRFKLVNDAFGHPVGDDALTLVGQVLTDASRPTDVVARMGGDELALLLRCCPYEQALERATEIVRHVRAADLLTADGQLVTLTISVGVAHAPVHARDVRALYTAADQALYQAKRAGRDRAREPA